MSHTTFEDVYANAYIRESVDVIVAKTIKQYPMLESHNKDIQQELLVSINNYIERFNPAEGSLESYFRMVLESSIKNILRTFFSKKEIINRCSVCEIDTLSENNADGIIEPFEKLILISDIHTIVRSLPHTEKMICEKLMDGCSFYQIATEMNTTVWLLKKNYISKIRQSFIEQGIKKFHCRPIILRICHFFLPI